MKSGVKKLRITSAIILGIVLLLSLCFVNLYAAPVTVGNFVVDYVISSDWGTGATINVTLTNNGPAINGWTVGWTFPGNQTIVNIWNASYTQSGASVSAKDAGFNASLSTGGSTSFGFNVNYSGTNTAPTSFTVNSSSTSTPTPTQRVTPSVTRQGTATATPTRQAASTPTRGVVTATPTRQATPTPTRGRVTATPTPYTGNPTVYICGDSTVANYPSSSYPQIGWGQMIPNFFTTSVKFDNRAVNGRSSKSFIDEGRLDAILSVIKPNDYLFVQFAHNDSKTDDPTRYTEPYTTFKDYLRQYVDRARQYNAIPVLITPVLRLRYNNGVFVNDFTDYCAAMKQVATEKNVKLIDLTTKCLNYLTSIGYDQAYTLYMVSSNGTDYTHFTEKGATQMARLVAEGVKEINVPISQYVK